MNIQGACNLGFPRMGKRRELKFALEKYWSGESTEEALLSAARNLRHEHWKLQTDAGFASPPSNDFSLYDHVLDMAVTLGAIPERFHNASGPVTLETYFAMARGSQRAPALEMTKWFDTNYHYVVPEFEPGMSYELRSTKVLNEYLEAKSLGVETRPVLLGPVSFVLLGKPTDEAVSREDVLDAILPLYRELLARLTSAGADWVQIDEPCLCLDLDSKSQELYRSAYQALRKDSSSPKLMLATYFGDLGANLDLALDLSTTGLHIDLVRAPHQLEILLSKVNLPSVLSLGLVDGRNIWRTDIEAALNPLQRAIEIIGKDRIEIAPSCSLLHTPVDLDAETKLDSETKNWLAFAKQKLSEVALLASAIQGANTIQDALAENRKIVQSRKISPRIHKLAVATALANIDLDMASRRSPYAARRQEQAAALSLPALPTTTIGSFPQTAEVRKMRAAFRTGRIDAQAYEKFLEEETERCIRFQESVGLDVLVHGEFERNDMV
jgi:5-methyltetrahydropteroyltriglutamate--homocysteine methyltransferase